MKKVIFWIANKRILDGYIGLFGVIVWYQICAMYHNTLEILHFSMRAWKWQIFSISLKYNTWNRRVSPFALYPPVGFNFSIGKWALIDTEAEARRLTSERVDRYMHESKERDAENERLIRAAKATGLYEVAR